MPGKKQYRGNFITKVNELSIYQNITHAQYSKNSGGEVTKIRNGSTSFDIYRGKKKLNTSKTIREATDFAEKYKLEMTKKKKRKLGLIK